MEPLLLACAIVLGIVLGCVGLLFALPPLAWLWCRWVDRWPVNEDALRILTRTEEEARDDA